jgi:hypothetical protein
MHVASTELLLSEACVICIGRRFPNPFIRCNPNLVRGSFTLKSVPLNPESSSIQAKESHNRKSSP